MALGMVQIYCSRFFSPAECFRSSEFISDFLSRWPAPIAEQKVADPHQSFVPRLAILEKNSGRPLASSLTRNREPAVAPSSCFVFPPAVVT